MIEPPTGGEGDVGLRSWSSVWSFSVRTPDLTMCWKRITALAASTVVGTLTLWGCAPEAPSYVGPWGTIQPGPTKTAAEFKADTSYCSATPTDGNFDGPDGKRFFWVACMLERDNTILEADGKVFRGRPSSYVDSRQSERSVSPPPKPRISYLPASSPPPSPTPATAPAPAPPAGDRYRPALEAIIVTDSNGWLSNKYDRGSLTNIQPVERNGKLVTVRADYTFNNGQPGWIEVNVESRVPCLRYWDAQGPCRSLDQSRVSIFAKAAQQYAKDHPNAGGQRGSYGSQSSVQYRDHDNFGAWFGYGPLY